MSREVPEGWKQLSLGDICAGGMLTDGDWIESKDQDPEGKIRLLQLSDIGDGDFLNKTRRFINEQTAERLKVTYLKKDDILLARMPDPLGRCCLLPLEEKAITAVDVCVIRPSAATDRSWLSHLLNSPEIRALINAQGTGTTRTRVSRKSLSALLLMVPPLHEQRRIAEILSSVDEAIAATRAVIEQTRKVKQGVLERLLTKGIGHTRFKQTEIGEIPEGWGVAEVQEHFHVQLGKMLSKAAKVGSSPSPYLRNANVQWGRIDTEDLLYMDFSEQEKEKFRLQPGDLLVCEGGEVGRCAIWNDGREMYYQKALHRLRERTGVVRNQFLRYVLLRVFTSKALSAGLVGTNSIAHFTREQFLRLKFPVPDADEQNVICETLGALDVSINESISKTEALLSLKSALMSDLLTGRKRVNDALPMAAE